MSRARLMLLVAVFAAFWPVAVRAQQHEHAEHAEGAEPQTEQPASGLPPITDADRTAAFPDVEGHTVHDRSIHYFVLFDQLEWKSSEDAGGITWDNKGWIGSDLNRVWFRTQGDAARNRLEGAHAQVLYGRAIARWWDFVAGVRQDIRPGRGRTWAAVGVQGLAPYWFEVEATAYVGEGGRTRAQFEVEYELLFTNRLILQPLIEFDIYGKADPERGIGSGLSSTDAALRLRYEIKREIAPYVGVIWHRNFDAARGDVRLAFGVRTWF